MYWMKWYYDITRLESGRTWLFETVAGVWFLGCWKWWTNLHTQTITKGVWCNNCRYKYHSVLCGQSNMFDKHVVCWEGLCYNVYWHPYQGLTCWVPWMLTDAHKCKKRYQNHFHATIQDGRWDSLVTFGHRGWDVGLYFWTRVQELVNRIALHKFIRKVEIKRMLPMWIYNAISFWNEKNDFCGFLADITAVETNSILSCRCCSPISTWLIAFTHCWMVPSQLHCLSPVTTIYICEMFLHL